MKQEYSYEDRVMGCDLFVSIVAESEAYADEAYAHMRTMAHAYDAQFSRFMEDSELSRLNEAKDMEVSRECAAVLLVGRELYEKTHGAFNPLVQVSRYGYDADIKDVLLTERGTDESPEPYDTDFASVRIQENRVALAEGQAVDVGGYLKGYVAERMVELAPLASGVIVNLGGDIYTRGRDQDGNAFQFDIENPRAPHSSITFAYENGGIATSGVHRRLWSRGGIPFHHILDASGTKNPDSDLVSATVLAKRGHDAEAYATAALVLGSKEGEHLLQEQGAEYCLIRDDGTFVVSPSFSARIAA